MIVEYAAILIIRMHCKCLSVFVFTCYSRLWDLGLIVKIEAKFHSCCLNCKNRGRGEQIMFK